MNTTPATYSSVRAPPLPEPLAMAADEATAVLALSKARKFQHYSFQNKGRERNNSKVPFAVDGLEGFRIFFGTGDFLGCFRGGVGMVASSSEADEPESNKSSAWAESWVASLSPTKVEDVHFTAIFTFTEEVFLVTLSPEDCATNFLLGFRGLAKESSCAEV
jgi:hypothetical protein